MSPEKIAENVRRFVAEELIIPFELVQPASRLQDYLAVTGADASKFMGAVAQRFGIELVALRPKQDCREKPLGFFSSIAMLLGRRQECFPSITVEDLIVAAQTKRLITR
jgi:hypothetical protein